MTIHKELGKIQRAEFGHGGYQDAQIGISFTLGGQSWGVSDFRGDWSGERSEHCKWTDEDRIRRLGETCMYLDGLLTQAKKNYIAQLVGVPVEATFDSNTLQSWRILTEVV